MKKFRFSLEKVLNYKNQTLETLKQELYSIQKIIDQLEEEIKKLQDIMVNTNKKLVEELKEGITTAKVSVYKFYLNDLNQSLTKLLEKKSFELRRLEAKKVQIVEMKSSISGLEKLKEKQLFEYTQMEKKEQELSIDEFVGHRLMA